MNTSQPIREALGTIPTDVSHSMFLPPEPSEMYAPSSHSAALDPTREIVVGGRGMGKEFLGWGLCIAQFKSITNRVLSKAGARQINGNCGLYRRGRRDCTIPESS